MFTDTRQNVSRNNRYGGMTLLGGSKIYWHLKDRILHPVEYFFINGWDDDVEIEDIHRPPSNLLAALTASNGCTGGTASGPARKRTRTNMGPVGRGSVPFGAKAVELCGNAMTMPDLASILVPAIFASQPQQDPLFEHQASAFAGPAVAYSGGKQLSFDLMMPEEEIAEFLEAETSPNDDNAFDEDGEDNADDGEQL